MDAKRNSIILETKNGHFDLVNFLTDTFTASLNIMFLLSYWLHGLAVLVNWGRSLENIHSYQHTLSMPILSNPNLPSSKLCTIISEKE